MPEKARRVGVALQKLGWTRPSLCSVDAAVRWPRRPRPHKATVSDFALGLAISLLHPFKTLQLLGKFREPSLPKSGLSCMKAASSFSPLWACSPNQKHRFMNFTIPASISLSSEKRQVLPFDKVEELFDFLLVETLDLGRNGLVFEEACPSNVGFEGLVQVLLQPPLLAKVRTLCFPFAGSREREGLSAAFSSEGIHRTAHGTLHPRAHALNLSSS